MAWSQSPPFHFLVNYFRHVIYYRSTLHKFINYQSLRSQTSAFSDFLCEPRNPSHSPRPYDTFIGSQSKLSDGYWERLNIQPCAPQQGRFFTSTIGFGVEWNGRE
ncbi:hypothetical protein AVEN_173366-1 [Araneus ventricosus]|uniref:Uncharacterized protein n=1 Tax=Araneus ventricosus TaxID=182803 RepID=A0A4Y2QES4_ARAVE|nr:hypothetical protein AVEN_173366-1 [Araneus ventricosus]